MIDRVEGGVVVENGSVSQPEDKLLKILGLVANRKFCFKFDELIKYSTSHQEISVTAKI